MTRFSAVASPFLPPDSIMAQWRWGPRVLAILAIAVGCSSAGIVSMAIISSLTGHFVAAVLVVPVFVAAWYGGVLSGVLTMGMQTAVTAALLEPVLSLGIASTGDMIRLGVTTAVSAVAIWITVRSRNTERHFRTVVDNALEGIWIVDVSGRTTFVNPRMAEMLGHPRASMYGRRFTEFVPQDTAAAVEDAFERLRRGAQQWNDLQLLRGDGSLAWVHYAATPLFDGGKFSGALSVVTDISQRKSDEETIRRQAEALQRADRQKDQFLAMLGHELRNPLSPIVTALALMDAKGGDMFQRERTIIARQIDALSRLVDDMSDVSRFMSGKMDIRRETVDVAQIIEKSCETVTALLSRKGHSLEVDAPSGLTVHGDGVRLQQVLVNLLTNAAKYTPSGGRIGVGARLEGDRVVIRVRDNGVGISQDFLPLVFELFTQKPQTIPRSEGGLGLGLAIVRHIVTAHGGTIDAYSEGDSRGSEFVVRLPRATRATHAPYATQASHVMLG